jgi:hypothetical protein
MYNEFIYPIFDYFRTIKRRELLYEIVSPIIITTILFLLFGQRLTIYIISNFNGYVVNLLAILIGFSITCITILVGSDNCVIKEMKEKQIDRRIGKEHISLFRLILVTFSYSIIIEIITLTFVLILILFFSSPSSANLKQTIPSTENFIFAMVTFFLMVHIILLNLRNISNFYLVFWKKHSG